jgi:hypothetical protein
MVVKKQPSHVDDPEREDQQEDADDRRLDEGGAPSLRGRS